MQDKPISEIDTRLLEILDTIAEGILIVDPTGTFTFVNRAAADILGMDRSRIVGRSFRDPCWKDIYSSEGEFTGEEKVFRLILAREPVRGLERAIRLRDGRRAVISISASLILDGHGATVGVLASFTDITARKKAEEAHRSSEELYRSLVEMSPDSIMLISLDLKILVVNRMALRMYGYDRVEEVVGRSIFDFFDPGEKERAFRNAMIRLKGLAPETIEYEFVKKDGTRFLGELRASVVCHPDGTPRFILGVVRDITAKRRMEEELLRASKLESVGILAGGIAHDFNNILTTILGQLSMTALQKGVDEQTRAGLAEAEKACLHAKNLTKQLLIFSSGGAPVRKAASLAALLRDTVSFTISGSKVQGEFSIPGDLWPTEIDEGQITQVINNLTINAIQAMPEGGLVRVRAENVIMEEGDARPLRQGRYVKFSIEDTGTGIAPEHLPKIFDPFFTTKAMGSGLGLTTTYSVVKNHGGGVLVDSLEGKGTTFDIYLPAGAETAREETKRISLTPASGMGRVLLVDDEAGIRRMTGRLLRHLGYDVVLAAEGSEAVEKYREAAGSGAPFDAVILDLTLQASMGGKETIGKLIEIDPHVRAIVSSGYCHDPVMGDFKAYGFKGVITKPYRIEDLAEVLRDVIRSM